jgi:hypothetical protein
MNNWIILLTTAIDNPSHTITDTEFRKDLYKKQINRWLNETNYIIVVVESSGYDFPDITHERLHKLSFIINAILPSSSQYEAVSIVYALNKIKNEGYYNNCTHILKVTGRYFLENLKLVLDESEQDKDLYLQKHFNETISWQNSEYYGIRKELYCSFIGSILMTGLMEHKLWIFASDKNICRIGTFSNDIRRGGDNMLIENL